MARFLLKLPFDLKPPDLRNARIRKEFDWGPCSLFLQSWEDAGVGVSCNKSLICLVTTHCPGTYSARKIWACLLLKESLARLLSS